LNLTTIDVNKDTYYCFCVFTPHIYNVGLRVNKISVNASLTKGYQSQKYDMRGTTSYKSVLRKVLCRL